MINGVSVDDNRLAEALDKIRSAADAMKNENGMRVTYFEATTAAAALLFAGAEADFAVWETGMGGRLDATSIVTPVATVITTISMEHKEYLGDTIGKIAFEKAGIIKKDVPALVGEIDRALHPAGGIYCNCGTRKGTQRVRHTATRSAGKCGADHRKRNSLSDIRRQENPFAGQAPAGKSSACRMCSQISCGTVPF